ncbi:MAG TPA: serine--tRNA ligase [Dehalococcoidia bacterium]|nr:serine--tRNA ligase [Dehalococcoidia bacterium]
MLSLQFIREHPDVVREALAARHTEAPLDEVLALDAERRRLLLEVENLRAEQNAAGKRIGATKDPAERQRLIDAMKGVSARIAELEPALKDIEERLEGRLLEIPNLPDASVPRGADESDNVVVRQSGEPRMLDFPARPHWELGEALGIIDFDRGVRLAGSRFYVLRGAGARLERALIWWMLDLHVSRHGYTELYLPAVVKEECMWASGQLPKFRDNLYHDVEDDIWLVPTAEVPLTNIHRDEILDGDALPISYVAYTPCFRREKMSAGRDVRGIKRGHQFDKVELYKFTRPEDSEAALQEMLTHAEAVVSGLGLVSRVVQICTGDLGFNAAKSYDLEVWSPATGEWYEVSSVSNCTDFQARRANIRFRREPGAKPEFVHTLNGSGTALPRVVAAILENFQRPDGSVDIPEALHPFMGGVTRLEPGR